MELYQGMTIVDLGLVYKDNLIIGDLQLGYEEYVAKQGILLPRFQFADIKERLTNILKKVTIKNLIINGDIKHEFGAISEQEWRDVLGIIDAVNKDITIIFVKGNHDLVLGPIARKRGVQLVDYYQLDDITILHGDKILPNLSKTLIIGHEHPAITFKERRDEKYKCFLKGTWKGHTLIVMPSFTNLHIGTDIRNKHHLSPFLQEDLGSFDVYIAEDKPYFFGKIKNIE
ncbi:MAG: metallophosphoesterase [Nanoarchaeota archaeon]|nr:metallophosphoesterase [Nanoarchaeota archaeon]